MAEPQIRYCTTTDGVSIAYYTIGEGPVLIDMGQPPTHLQMEWRLDPIRAWYQRFAQHRRFVRFDARGTGLSDRDVRSFSLETLQRDLEAVVRAVASGPAAGGDAAKGAFTLMGAINSSAAAIAYAAANPARVDRLVLWCPYSRGPEFFDDPGTRALRDMVDRDWHMMTETAMRSRFGWTAEEHARDYAVLWRAAITPQMTARLMDSLRELDVTPLLPAVAAPTLVLQREDRGADVARRIASAIPQASVALLPGVSAAPYLDDADDIWARISDFLELEDRSLASTVTAAKDQRPRAASGALQTILFTDIEANTELLQRVGDTAWRDILREHERTTRALLAEHGGTEIKTIGDAFMTSFTSASAALECAIALQRAFAAHNTQPGAVEAHMLRVRIGINTGEPIAEDDDLFGTAVTTASRIQALAKGGEILVADVVRQLVAGKGFLFDDRGEHTLRGFEDPVRIFAVRIGD